MFVGPIVVLAADSQNFSEDRILVVFKLLSLGIISKWTIGQFSITSWPIRCWALIVVLAADRKNLKHSIVIHKFRQPHSRSLYKRSL